MEIHPSNKIQSPHLPPLKPAGVESGQRVDSASGSPRSSNIDAVPSRSSEIRELTERMRSLPEVRDELIATVQQRMLNGEYETRQAAQSAAAAILK